MAHSLHHAQSSARRFGGKPEDYLAIHNWFDQTKAHVPDARHRLLLHNSFGIFLCEQFFGVSLTNSDGKEVPVRLIGEQHVREDFGGIIPDAASILREFPLEDWMYRQAEELSQRHERQRQRRAEGRTLLIGPAEEPAPESVSPMPESI